MSRSVSTPLICLLSSQIGSTPMSSLARRSAASRNVSSSRITVTSLVMMSAARVAITENPPVCSRRIPQSDAAVTRQVVGLFRTLLQARGKRRPPAPLPHTARALQPDLRLPPRARNPVLLPLPPRRALLPRRVLRSRVWRECRHRRPASRRRPSPSNRRPGPRRWAWYRRFLLPLPLRELRSRRLLPPPPSRAGPRLRVARRPFASCADLHRPSATRSLARVRPCRRLECGSRLLRDFPSGL